MMLSLSVCILTQLNMYSQTIPAKVQIKETHGKYSFYVNNKEFYVNGAGCGFGNIEYLGKSGANCLRTWSTSSKKIPGKRF